MGRKLLLLLFSYSSCVQLFCDPVGCSPSGSFVHGILQARILGWAAISSSRGSSWFRDWTCVSCLEGRFFTTGLPGKPGRKKHTQLSERENSLRPKSWTVKEAECRRIEAFQLWCWSRLLRAPWTARRSNQSILKEINPEYTLEGLMLKLKLQYFGHLIRRADSLEKTLTLGKI